MIWSRVLLGIVVLLAASCAGMQESSTAAGPGEPDRDGMHGDSEIAVRMDRYLSALESLGFSGAIIASTGDGVVLRKGYGLANRESRRPYMPDTVQTHGSITKQMTAAAVLLLEMRGELTVEDSLARFFDELPEDKRKITLHQLLTHSAGLPSGIGPDNEPIDADQYVERVLAAPLQFEPGSGYAYSNAGYALLGIIVERVSGQGYEAFLREELLLPAGLTDTGYLLPAWEPYRLATGYRDGQHWGQVYRRGWREDGPGWHLRANGGLHTTVDDMHRWLKTLQGEGVLDAENARRWTTGYVDEGVGDSMYGYGWAVHDTEMGPMVAHNGGNGIFSADFVWLPEAGLFFYIHGNTSIIPAARLRDGLLGAAFDPEFVMPRRIEPDPGADPANALTRSGDYTAADGTITLRADDTRLVATVSGQAALDLVLEHGPGQRAHFAALNRRAMQAMERLQAGREDAFEGLVDADTDAAARARSMLDVVAQGGDLQSLTLVGSIANVPGSRFADYGAWTTFVRAEYDQLVQMWSVLWRDDGTYRGTAIGPVSDVPSFILVPTGSTTYSGMHRGAPWSTVAFRFVDGCLVADKGTDQSLVACR